MSNYIQDSLNNHKTNDLSRYILSLKGGKEISDDVIDKLAADVEKLVKKHIHEVEMAKWQIYWDCKKRMDDYTRKIEELENLAKVNPDFEKRIQQLQQKMTELDKLLKDERKRAELPPPPAFMPIVDYLIKTYSPIYEMENMRNLIGRINTDSPSDEAKQAYDKLNNELYKIMKMEREQKPTTVVNGDMVGQKIQENFGNNYNLESGANILPPDDKKKITR